MLLGRPEDAEAVLGLTPESASTPNEGVRAFVLVRACLLAVKHVSCLVKIMEREKHSYEKLNSAESQPILQLLRT